MDPTPLNGTLFRTVEAISPSNCFELQTNAGLSDDQIPKRGSIAESNADRR